MALDMNETIDLQTLPLAELKTLQKDVAKAIESFEARRISEARAKLEAEARAMGFSLSDIVAGKTAAKPKSPAKYRDPENAENTWSGRGRKPAWFIEAVNSGTPIEDLEISEA